MTNDQKTIPVNFYSSSNLAETINFSNIIQASQSLSRAIQLEQLIPTFMQIVIENTGAKKVVLLLLNNNQLMVEAIASMDEGFTQLAIPLENYQAIPIMLVNDVRNNLKTIVLDDKTNPNNLINDPYLIQEQPKNLLCTPILNQDKLVGLLYLENQLTTNVFTEDCLESIQIFCTQLAISLENARFYQQSQNRIQQLEDSLNKFQKEQEQLQRSRQMFQLVMDNIPQLIFWKDIYSIYLGCNHKFAEIAGVGSPENIVGKIDYELPWTTKESDWFRECDRRVMESNTPELHIVETQLTADGEETWVETNKIPIHDVEGNVVGIIGTAEDITLRKEAENMQIRLAQEQEAKNVALRMNQQIEAKNQELAIALEQLKTTQAELIQSEKMAALGQLVAGIAHEINTPLGAIRSSAGNIAKFLEQILEKLPILFQSISFEEIQIFSDLLQRSLQQESRYSTREERQLKRALKLQLETLEIAEIDIVADRFITMGVCDHIEAFIPLLNKSNGLEILEIAYKLSELKRGTTTINTAIDRASKVVFALKTYARHQQSTEMTLANLTDGIETVLTLYQNQLKQGVELITKYEEIPPILCYPDELNQVWTNLIHNALQAMDYRGNLTIEVSGIDHHIKIRFTDTGQGIPPEIISRIFEPFFTTKPPGEGSGLGLDIVKQILNKHSGKITVESQPGETTFQIILPIQPIKENQNV